MFQNLIDKSMKKSPFIFHVNAGSCNGCDIELVAVLTPRYDAERYGFRLTGSPRHADIVVVSGPITMQSRDRLIRTLAQVPEPFCVVSLGSCPRSGNVFKGSYAIDGPLEKWTHVDVSVGGCTPKPEAIIAALAKATEILEEKRKAMHLKPQAEEPAEIEEAAEEAVEAVEEKAEEAVAEAKAEVRKAAAEVKAAAADAKAEVKAEVKEAAAEAKEEVKEAVKEAAE